ncbi:uncharacterized protein [Anoplolepis gracilipes]|uniref:uncharacterized protein n=1 Tax=Anoplolepis gracilipes TaxID=354296 RepID=UPI003BA17D94
MSAMGNSSRKACCFCNLTEDNEVEYGKFYEYNGIVTHYYCLLLSSNMEQKGNDDEGILGFLTEDIQKELRRGKRLACSYCKKIGATLGCCNVKCKRIFHFPCGLKAGSLHQYFGEFRSYCVNHRPKQQLDQHILKQISSLDNVLCYICYDKVNPSDFVNTLWAPCCKKNAFFHRKCVQQLALSAGYFFKCPLCNNKQDFRNAMLEYGIFIPSQDASWELVPNAFEELLYRHDQCDAVKCLCPKGRKHVSSNAKWELTLCRICGSQGIHMACGQLKWANPVWECTECTSILHNSKNNENAESDNSFDDLNRASDSDSDTDISVGMDFPVSCPSPNFSSSSSSITLPDSNSDVKLRPGPRSFKLQQRMIKWLELTNEFIKKNTPKVSQDTNTSLKNGDNDNNTREEKQVSSNDVTSQPIQKEADVITIESDDDNEIEIITLKQRTDFLAPLQLTSQSNIHVLSSNDIIRSQLNTVETATTESLNSTSTNLLEKDNIELYKSVATKPNISNKSEPIVSKQLVTSQESMPDLIVSNSNDFDYLDTEMNIKITNITSVPPEVFESVPNEALYENSIDTSSPSTSKSLEKLVTYVAPPKRIYEEVHNVYNNYKKIKRNHIGEKSLENNSTAFCNIVACNESKEQNGKISPSKINEIHEKKNPLTCTSVNEPSNSYYNQKDDSSTQFMSLHKADDVRCTSQVAENSEGNIALLNIQQSNENSAVSASLRRTYLPSSKRKSQICLPLGNLPHIYPNSAFTHTSVPKPVPITNKDVENNMQFTGRNMLYTPSNTIMPTDFTLINHPSTFLSKSMELYAAIPVIANGNQKNLLDEKTSAMKNKVFANVSSPDDSSSNGMSCDGDAGCCPAEIKSSGQKKTDPSSSYRSADSSNVVESHNVAATRSVFPRVTNNHSTCHQPRLIPQYVNLHDLKFRCCKPDHVQMVLYDTFSVNISIKNSKESKILTDNEMRLVSSDIDQIIWSATHVSNNMFNEHNILNKQIDASDSIKFIRCLAFDKNTVNHNNENNFRHNDSESCLKVSIDLCKIQSLIDSKPELFVS